MTNEILDLLETAALRIAIEQDEEVFSDMATPEITEKVLCELAEPTDRILRENGRTETADFLKKFHARFPLLPENPQK